MDKKSETTKNTWLKKSYRRQIHTQKKSLINNDKTEKNISFKKEKKKNPRKLG